MHGAKVAAKLQKQMIVAATVEKQRGVAALATAADRSALADSSHSRSPAHQNEEPLV